MSGYQGLVMEMGSDCKWAQGSFWGDGHFWKLDCGDGYILCKQTENDWIPTGEFYGMQTRFQESWFFKSYKGADDHSEKVTDLRPFSSIPIW